METGVRCARRNADESILDTYNAKRLENAKNLLRTTDRAFTFGTHDDFLTAFVRTHVFPFVAEFALKFDSVKHAVFPLVSQFSINYRNSQLSVQTSDQDFKIKAGDRMPYFLINGKSVFDFLREPRFHFLVFSNGEIDFEEFLQEYQESERWIDCQSFPFAPHVAEIFGADKSFCVLLRPDNHLAFISERISVGELKNYCSTANIRF